MIVAAPDGKNIDFGDLPPEQVTATMSNLYAGQSNAVANDEIPAKRTDITDWAGANIAGAAKGALSGFNDEMMTGIQSPFGYLGSQVAGTNKPLSQVYDENLARNRQLEQNIEKRNPVAFGTGQIEGALLDAFLTRGSSLNKAIGSGIKNGLLPNATSSIGRAANLASKIGVSSATGAAGSAVAGFGDASGQNGRLQNAEDTGLIGAGLGAAMPAGGAVFKGIASDVGAALKGISTHNAWDEIGQSIKDKGSALYQQMRSAGADINLSGLTKISDAIDNALSQGGKLYASRHSGTLEVIQEFKDKLKNGSMSLEDLDNFRKDFREVVSDNTDKINGTGSDGQKAQAAIHALDDAVDGLTGTDITNPSAVSHLNDARAAWGQFKRFDRVSQIIQNADGNVNKIRNGLTNFTKNVKDLKRQGFTDEEIASLQDAASGGQTLRALGTFGIDLGANKNIGLPGLALGGSFFTGGAGVPIVAAGTVARAVGKAATKGRAAKALETIAQTPQTKTNQLLTSLGAGVPVIPTAQSSLVSRLANMLSQPDRATQ